MRFLFALVILSTVSALGILVTPVSAEKFNTNLTLGSKGSDVVALQRFLVAKDYLEMPAGVAFGYFGTLTKSAVAKWQRINAISPAVGYFGPISRRVMDAQESLGARAVVPPPSSASTTIATKPLSASSTFPSPNLLSRDETDTPTLFGMRVNRVVLFRPFPFEARPGDPVVLDGSGFSKTLNEVYFNDGHRVTATSTDGLKLKIFLPADLAEGEYELSVSNALGSSKNPDIPIHIKVMNDPQPAPAIESASIIGDTVTLIGEGFTSANNLLTTLGESSRSVSSDGANLTFRLTDLSLYDQIKQHTLGQYQAALWIYVYNEHGINTEPYKLDITI